MVLTIPAISSMGSLSNVRRKRAHAWQYYTRSLTVQSASRHYNVLHLHQVNILVAAFGANVSEIKEHPGLFTSENSRLNFPFISQEYVMMRCGHRHVLRQEAFGHFLLRTQLQGAFITLTARAFEM
jgi:hypothetical protein